MIREITEGELESKRVYYLGLNNAEEKCIGENFTFNIIDV